MAGQSILVVDDDPDILKLLQYNLEKEGYRVLCAKDGEEGLSTARKNHPDAVILDLMLPGSVDGLEVCKILRRDRNTLHIPVIMLTAKNTEVDQIVGLEVGASDYVAKPFSVKVLLARLKNVLRRRDAAARTVLRVGEAALDKERQSFTLKGKTIALTKLEFRILSFLMANPGKVFSRDELLSGAWEGEAFVVDRTVDVHVKSIRRKLGKFRDYVQTVRGTGYRFVEFEGDG